MIAEIAIVLLKYVNMKGDPMKDIVRVSTAVPKLKLADTKYNCEQMISSIKKAKDEKSSILLFPELSLTGYTCGDLFFQNELLEGVKSGIAELARASRDYDGAVVLGAPITIHDRLYNAALVLSHGRVCGILPKTFLPDHDEFCEKRWFSSSRELDVKTICSSELGIDEVYDIPTGAGIIFDVGASVSFGIEICEDLWTPIPPSSYLALGGAELILNLSASNETALKRDSRRRLVADQSARCIAAYVYASAGAYESTTDLIFSGHCIFAQCGELLLENDECPASEAFLTCDIDLGRLRADRLVNTNYKDSVYAYGKRDELVRVKLDDIRDASNGELLRISRSPFLPSSPHKAHEYCMEIFELQTAALARRLECVGALPVVGVSGGLDSTLALLVSCAAVKKLGKPCSSVYGITLPGFGTSGRTYNNSIKLMQALGVTVREISIKKACLCHFEDIGQDPACLDLTYENAQARERTQVLMDFAGKVGGLVVGTGDLSELALGWCTYNADHMSMYGVNAGVPKTVIRKIVGTLVDDDIFKDASDVLADVLDTPISPELLPTDASGEIAQVTEDIVGPYELHDFYIYYALRYGFSPEKIYELAKLAFAGAYDDAVLLKWLKNFYRRFFTQQFKRSCQPDGVKVDVLSLSPRGDLRMPSDASFAVWQRAVDSLES